MKNKPMFFSVMPLVLTVLAFSMPAQIAIIYDISIFEFEAIMSKLTPLNYLLMGMFLWLSIATYKIDKNLFILLPFINLFVFLNNYVVGSFGEDFSIVQTTLASSLFLALTLSYYLKDNYKIINDIKTRWWLTSPRNKLKIPLTIISSKDKIKTQSFDVSKSGLFAINDPDFELFQIPKDNIVDITIHTEDNTLKMKGKLVRKALSKGHYPEGVGIQFLEEDPDYQNWLSRFESMQEAA
jgi:hypothetical protein